MSGQTTKLNPQATWPFPNATEPASESGAQAESDDLKVNLPVQSSGEYRITLSGRGTESGIGTISQEQYDFWSHPDNESGLADALNDPEATEFENEAGDMVEIPEECRFEYYYSEFSDVAFLYGVDVNSAWITVTGPDDHILFDCDLNRVMNRETDSSIIVADYGTEVYSDDLEPGLYVGWVQSGKGTYFEGTFDLPADQPFDIDKLVFIMGEVDGDTVIEGIRYAGEDIENWGGDWSGKYSDYRVFEIEPDEPEHDQITSA